MGLSASLAALLLALLMSASASSIGVIISNVAFDYHSVPYVCFNGSHIYVVQDNSPLLIVYGVDGKLITQLYIGETPLICAVYGSYLYVFTSGAKIIAYDYAFTKVAEVEVDTGIAPSLEQWRWRGGVLVDEKYLYYVVESCCPFYYRLEIRDRLSLALVRSVNITQSRVGLCDVGGAAVCYANESSYVVQWLNGTSLAVDKSIRHLFTYRGNIYAVTIDSLMKLEDGKWINLTKLHFPRAVAVHGDYIYVLEGSVLTAINELKMEKKRFGIATRIRQMAAAGDYAVLVYNSFYGDGFVVVKLGDVEPGSLTACVFAAPWDLFGIKINNVKVLENMYYPLYTGVPCITLTDLIPGVYRIEVWKTPPQAIFGVVKEPPESRVYDVWVAPGGTAVFIDLYTSAIYAAVLLPYLIYLRWRVNRVEDYASQQVEEVT